MRPRDGQEPGYARLAGLLGRRPWHVGLGATVVGLALAGAEDALPLAGADDALPLAGADDALPLALAAGALIVLAALRLPHLGALAAVLILVGAAAGEIRLRALERPAGRIRDGERVDLRAHLLTRPRPGGFGSSAEIGVSSGRLEGARLLLRIARWSPLPGGIEVGEGIRVEGRLETPRPDWAEYLRARGIAAELLADGVTPTGRRRGGLAGGLDRMRERAERAVVAGMDERDGALLRGMVLGQDEAIDDMLRDDFRDSGLAHLLAVSGQNVMLLAALALPALALAGLGIRARMAALAGLIALYVPLAGAGPSLQRAGVMGLAGIAAMAASRPASRSYALLLAAAATLAWNPRAWADPGWQLSFAAVAGILVLGVPLSRILQRAGEQLIAPRAAGRSRPAARAFIRLLAEGVAITLAATLATAPLLAHHFGSVPLAGLPANLLALPAVAPAMWLGMLKIALGQTGPIGTPLAEALGPLAAVPVGFLAALPERFADVRGGQLPLPLRSPGAVATSYAALAAAALLARRALRPLQPRFAEGAARWRRFPRARRAALAALLAVGLLAAVPAALGGPDPPGRLTVRFLDVGQGDSTLIQHPDGSAVLFDGGPPEAGVARLLRKAGVKRLALVVATHPSRDHHGGLLEVLRRFPVGLLLDGGDGTTEPAFRAVLREAAARGVKTLPAIAPLSLGLAGGKLRIRLLSPPPRPPGPPPDDPNPRGAVTIVSAGAFDLLLSADAESEALLPLQLPDVDAMKVPHHGSSDPGLPEVLERIDPEVAVIEVGVNTYGHPAPSTLAALDRAGVPTYRTDEDGTVTLSVDAGRMQVDTER